MSRSRLPRRTARPRLMIAWSPRLVGDAVGCALRMSGFCVAELYQDGTDYMALVAEWRPDVVIVDLEQVNGGIPFALRVLEAFPAVRILAVADKRDSLVVRSVANAGLQGYFSKNGNLCGLVEAIEAAADQHVAFVQGEVPWGHETGPEITEEQRHAALIARHITPRERNLLSLLVRGAATTEIISRLSITRNTLRTYLEMVFSKLQVHSRLQAAILAVKYGIVDPIQAKPPEAVTSLH